MLYAKGNDWKELFKLHRIVHLHRQVSHLTYLRPKESHFRGVKLDPLNTRRDILLTNWLQEHLQHIVWRQLASTLRCCIVLSLEVSGVLGNSECRVFVLYLNIYTSCTFANYLIVARIVVWR